MNHQPCAAGWMLGLVVVTAVSVIPPGAAAQTTQPDSSWVGKQVVRAREEVQLRAFNKATGKTETIGRFSTTDARVDKVQGDWVWVRSIDKEGWVLKGEIVLADQAIPYFTGRIQNDSNDSFAFTQRGTAWFQQGDLQKSLSDFNQSLRIRPQDASSWHNRGVVRSKLGQYDQALADYNEALRLNPEEALYYNHRGETRFELKAYDQAIADHTAAIRLLPKFAVAYANRGWAWWAKGEGEIALADFSEATRLDPDLLGPYNGRARIYYDRGAWAQAVAEDDKILRLNPSQTLTYSHRGWSWLKQGQNEQALADLNEALRRDPKLAVALQGRGICYYRLANYEAALRDCREVIRLDPDLAFAHYYLGDTLRRLKDYDGALTALSEEIRRHPASADAYVLRSTMYRYLMDFDRAVADATEAIRLNPRSASGHQERGKAYRRMGALEEAQADFDTAIQLTPTWASNYSGRGLVRYLLGNYSGALADFTEANRQDPQDWGAYAYRAMLFATAADADYRDLDQADAELNLARERSTTTELLEVEAAIAAARGDFPTAVRLQEELLQDPQYGPMPEQHARLALYREQKPFVQEPPSAEMLARTAQRLVPPAESNGPAPGSLAGDAGGAELPGWGTVVDPRGDCEMAAHDKTLSIMVPGGYHDLFTSEKLVNFDAPRVLQSVNGDFVVQVRVRRFPIPPAGSAANPDNPYSFVSGGIMIWQDQRHFVRWQRAANGDSRRVVVLGQFFADGAMTGWNRVELTDEDVWLRAERRAGRFTLEHSADGQTWTPLESKWPDQKLNERVQIGVFSINATTRPVTQEFTDLQVTEHSPLSMVDPTPQPRPFAATGRNGRSWRWSGSTGRWRQGKDFTEWMTHGQSGAPKPAPYH